eukprot:TRINITY_DN60110_c0_g1_i1.p2 TRINITY_DN60110_c0_g1~~TRINITY_DN60110_c0_g1_i1.p2  ORF type:complete len:317 (+),score=91.44 TRINITY_DN60110_c0_g1_i1:83-952(+)
MATEGPTQGPAPQPPDDDGWGEIIEAPDYDSDASSEDSRDRRRHLSLSSIKQRVRDRDEDLAALKRVVRGKDADECSIYVGMLDFSAIPEDLFHLFKKYGPIERITILTDATTNHPKAFAYLRFQSLDAAEAALEMDGLEWRGRNLQVKWKKHDPQKQINPKERLDAPLLMMRGAMDAANSLAALSAGRTQPPFASALRARLPQGLGPMGQFALARGGAAGAVLNPALQATLSLARARANPLAPPGGAPPVQLPGVAGLPGLAGLAGLLPGLGVMPPPGAVPSPLRTPY